MKKNLIKKNACRICGGRCNFFDAETMNNNEYTIVECLQCGTIQTLEHYSPISPDYINLNVEDLGDAHIWMNRDHKKNAYDQFVKNLKSLDIDLMKSKIIDIGCGTAGFGEYCIANSIKYSGFDASQAQVEYANRLGIDVTHATSVNEYAATRGVEPDLSVIFTLWDVLEHIRDPKKLFDELKSYRANVKYIFVSVPNGGALRWKRTLYKKLIGKYSYDSWEHVFYYTPKSLSLYLENLGMDVMKVGSVVCYPRKLSVMELTRRFTFILFSLFKSKAPQIYVFARIK
jgi:2-polyprenyl-3-methyl-5-hydroxy-6-metoxy-1,4-benzoquinol methylase